MDGAAIVPHQEIARPPHMLVDELPPLPDLVELLQDDVASKSSIVEDLLASEELRSLDRRVRVICGGELISEPGGSGAQQTPSVIWPRKQAN